MSAARYIRFTEEGWETVQRAATLAGTSASDFVRGAAVARAVFTITRNGGEFPDALAEAYDAVHRAVAAMDAQDVA